MGYFPKCVVLQGNHHVKGNNIDICKLESRVGVKQFFFPNVQKTLCCDLVLYVVGRCDANSSFFWCYKHLLINLFLFVDVNNALGPWVNSL